MLAEHLAEAGCEVEVCTSCALDSSTWADHYPPGAVEINGVMVHRFRSTGRDPQFDELSAAVLADPSSASAAMEQQWLTAQGPVSPAAIDAAATTGADVIVLYPYLY